MLIFPTTFQAVKGLLETTHITIISMAYLRKGDPFNTSGREEQHVASRNLAWQKGSVRGVVIRFSRPNQMRMESFKTGLKN